MAHPHSPHSHGPHPHGPHDHLDHSHDHLGHGPDPADVGHTHGPLEAITHVHGGPVVLDIGGEVGALVLYLDLDLVGTEVHLAAADGRITHTGVWLRSIGPVERAAAVFCQLPAGTYTLLDPPSARGRSVRIDGGGAVEVDLRRDDRLHRV